MRPSLHYKAQNNADEDSQNKDGPAKFLTRQITVAGLRCVHKKTVAHQKEEFGEGNVHSQDHSEKDDHEQHIGVSAGIVIFGGGPVVQLGFAGKQSVLLWRCIGIAVAYPDIHFHFAVF